MFSLFLNFKGLFNRFSHDASWGEASFLLRVFPEFLENSSPRKTRGQFYRIPDTRPDKRSFSLTHDALIMGKPVYKVFIRNSGIGKEKDDLTHPRTLRSPALAHACGLQHTTVTTAVRAGKSYNIMDCFARPLPNAVRKTPTVGSCPVRPAAARHSPIWSRVMSARAVAVLRRGTSRWRFARRARRPVRPHFAVVPTVVCNATGERQNTKGTANAKARRPSWPPKSKSIQSNL